MKSKLWFIVSILVFGFVAIKLVSSKPQEQAEATVAPSVVATTQSNVSSQVKSAELGAVTVELTPVQVTKGQDLVLEMKLNTHSVDLDYDYSQVITLKDDLGKLYPLKEWTGQRGGHHLTGELVFPSLQAEAKSFSIDIKGIDNQSASLSWQL